MRILHLFSDWKWTGPAEPVLNLALALRARGHEVWLACRAAPREASTSLPGKARARGLEPVTDFFLRARLHPFEIGADVRDLPEWIDAHGIDLVHTHLSHDHFLARWAAPKARRRPLLVRTNHKGVPLDPTRGNAWLLSRTDGYFTFTRRGLAQDLEAFRLRSTRAWLAPTAVDLDRFDPAKARPGARAALGLSAQDIVVGIVARVQRHRKFRELLEGFALARAADPRLKLVIVGRGTHREAVAERPARELGLDRAVVFTGYREADDYVDTVGAFDIKVFLVPGSDGTCRAVREAMALGKPIIAARTGMLPELVEDGKTGLIVEPVPGDLAMAMRRLAVDAVLRARLGAGGREKALAEFKPERQAEVVEQAYRALTAG